MRLYKKKETNYSLMIIIMTNVSFNFFFFYNDDVFMGTVVGIK